jgi:hypothetical protein
MGEIAMQDKLFSSKYFILYILAFPQSKEIPITGYGIPFMLLHDWISV